MAPSSLGQTAAHVAASSHTLRQHSTHPVSHLAFFWGGGKAIHYIYETHVGKEPQGQF